MRGRRDDEAGVVLQHLQPAGDIGRVVLAGFERQTKIRTEEGGADLGDQLFAGIAGIAEALAMGLEALDATGA